MNAKRFALISVVMVVIIAVVSSIGAQEGGGANQPPRNPRPDILRDLMGIVVAETGLEPQSIMEQLRAGATLAEVITANGGNVDNVVAQAVTLLTDRINAAVGEGRMTQERADQILANLETRITEALNRENRPPLSPRQAIEQRSAMAERLFAEVREAVIAQTGLESAAIMEQLRGGATLADILTNARSGQGSVCDRHGGAARGRD